MIYRVTAKFSDTEAAQRAARRINNITGDVYEVRLSYRGEREDNSLIYGGNNVAEFPRGYSENRQFYNVLNEVEDIHYGEISEECYMAVFCKDNVNVTISEAIINCGGYDINVEEEKLL